MISSGNQQILEAFDARDRRPTGVMIQVSARCNLACVMCGYVGKTPNTGFIDLDLFGHVLDDCRAYGISHIYMETAWGEPMLHPRIFDLLAMATGFRIVLSTNLTPLNARRIERLAETGLDTLQLSFCGYDRASYEAIYAGAKFDHVVENLRLIRERFAALAPGTRLLVNGVALRNDQMFVERTIAFLRELGFGDEQMEIKLPNNFGGLYTGSPSEASRGIHTFKDLHSAELEICSVLLNNPGVYVDGRVTACGCLDNASALIIGDIRRESLREMRYGPRFEALLQAFAVGDIGALPLCSVCDVPYCTSRMVNFVSPEWGRPLPAPAPAAEPAPVPEPEIATTGDAPAEA
jgi:MoaA/NifB/PqqE/SkfB family radical SAM enzyme